jgi:hypothetical protein
MSDAQTFTAFAGARCVAVGGIEAVARAVAANDEGSILIFDDTTGHQVELDLRHGPEHAAADYRSRTAPMVEPSPPHRGRGRPRLGVVAREVTLLPRHWEWLARQPGGASATLRRLVEDARRSGADADRARQAQEALYRVMSVLAGNAPGFEEASRALFANDDARLDAILRAWPSDVAAYLAQLAAAARAARPLI